MDQKLIKQLEETCSARGVRLTPQRKRVYELICDSNKASSAYELLDQLKSPNRRLSRRRYTEHWTFF
ncbi:zinc uptake regulation protein ZUR [Vibrio maritimus]|uniref:Zinc uptake regulation protein ZUR n=1 Tax=Vibrio maritimus TaxID=990268 RepID=A0A090U4M1_9VIBR|nr:zinc uptake regulation protein ZUR [Vibrio maritimus]